MKNLFAMLVIILSALTLSSKQANAAIPQQVAFSNNTSWTIYVYVYAKDPPSAGGAIHQSNIMAIAAGSSTFNMFPGNTYTPISWSGKAPDPYAEFFAVDYFEYDPTNVLCSPGGALPGSSCSFISASMDIATTPSTCMETSGSTCAPMPPNTTISGNVSGYYLGNMNVFFN